MDVRNWIMMSIRQLWRKHYSNIQTKPTSFLFVPFVPRPLEGLNKKKINDDSAKSRRKQYALGHAGALRRRRCVGFIKWDRAG